MKNEFGNSDFVTSCGSKEVIDPKQYHTDLEVNGNKPNIGRNNFLETGESDYLTNL